jgi:hypothetical protein
MPCQSPSVTYWQLARHKTNIKRLVRGPKVINACFAALGGYDYDTGAAKTLTPVMRYSALIDKSLTKKAVVSWLDWLQTMFGPKSHLFRARIDFANRRVIYYLKTEDMTKYRALTYLTAMRYVDEYPAILQQTIVLTGTDEERFAAFQTIHETAYKSSGNIGYNLGGHGLMYKVNRVAGIASPIKLTTFWANLDNVKKTTVHSHFDA